MKAFFLIEDNVLDKKLQRYVDDKAFTGKKNVKKILNELVECFARNFTEGNIELARSRLVQRNIEMRRKDAVLLAFFAGTLLITFLVTIAAIIIPADA